MYWASTSSDNRVWDGTRVKLFGGRNEFVAFQLILEASGFELVPVDCGTRAVELLAAAPGGFRAALLDLTMPGMDGEATFDALRAVCGDLPIVLMSGFSESECRDRMAGRDLAGFVQKPFRIADLVESLRLALEREA